MEISNIRKEIHDKTVYLKTDIKCGFSSSKELWFSTDVQYRDWITDDAYDSFMIAAVYAAMYYGEDIVIKGGVNKSIYRNLIDYIIPVIKSLHPDFKTISVSVDHFTNSFKSADNIIGTGFSGGVDSFSTIIDRFENEKDIDYKINSLFFFNVGQYRNSDGLPSKDKAIEFYDNSKLLADELGLPYIFLDTNLFDFYLPHWEYDAGPMCRTCSILVFQRVLKKYYVSGSNHYLQQNSSIDKHLDDVSDEFIYYMLSPDNLEIILDGNQYYRSQKIQNIANFDYVRRNLNVCVNNSINVLKDKNCSICHKCLRTLIILESLGELKSFENVFDLKKYSKRAFSYKCRISLENGKGAFATENYNFAKSHGVYMPSKLVAWCYLFPERFGARIKRLLNVGK